MTVAEHSSRLREAEVPSEAHRVVVIGASLPAFSRLVACNGPPCALTVIDQTTHHLFAPLLYQVATGILSEGEIAPATRDVLRRQRNANVILGQVTDIDLVERSVRSRVLDLEVVTPYES